ncbi:MAG: diguanylate cyclase [Nitrospirota bacterium]
MSSDPKPISFVRNTDETTIGMTDASPQRRLNRQERNLGCLVVIAGLSIGEKIALSKDRMVIGRQADSDICFDDTLVSRHHAEIVTGPDGTSVLRDLTSRNGTLCNDRRITEHVLRDGDVIWIGRSALKYLAPDSAENMYLSVMADRARLDELTGLVNRRTFQEYLERMVSRCRSLHEPMAVILIDVDHFKRVNDTWGHLAGDFVLKELSSLLKRAVRPTDLLARYGGEELGLVVPYTTVVEALGVAERMRTTVAGHQFLFNGQSIPMTISLGVAELGDQTEHVEALLQSADKALYAAKQNGRNRSVCSAET